MGHFKAFINLYQLFQLQAQKLSVSQYSCSQALLLSFSCCSTSFSLFSFSAISAAGFSIQGFLPIFWASQRLGLIWSNSALFRTRLHIPAVAHFHHQERAAFWPIVIGLAGFTEFLLYSAQMLECCQDQAVFQFLFLESAISLKSFMKSILMVQFFST